MTFDKWWCYYGEDRRILEVPGTWLLVLEPDSLGPLSRSSKKNHVCLGYLSLGEAEEYRDYFAKMVGKPFLLETNPSWPDARLVDIRNKEWQRHILSQAASILLRGYDGIMLDTIDTAETLLGNDPERFKGIDTATVALVGKLRAAFPDAFIVANGGGSMAKELGKYVDGFMQESVIATHGDGNYHRWPKDGQEWVNNRVANYKATGLPILALDYLPESASQEEHIQLTEALRKKSLHPAISTRDLMKLPTELPGETATP